MFAYDASHWLTFFGAAILLTLAPGPDLAFILGQSIKRGRQAGFEAMYGIWTGAFAHVFLAALGLSTVLATSALAFSVIKWIGAAYLIWLGLAALRSNGLLNGLDKPVDMDGSPFRQGMLVAALNPKTAIFFLSFLSPVCRPGRRPRQPAAAAARQPGDWRRGIHRTSGGHGRGRACQRAAA